MINILIDNRKKVDIFINKEKFDNNNSLVGAHIYTT